MSLGAKPRFKFLRLAAQYIEQLFALSSTISPGALFSAIRYHVIYGRTSISFNNTSKSRGSYFLKLSAGLCNCDWRGHKGVNCAISIPKHTRGALTTF